MALELLRRLRERDPDHGGLDERMSPALIEADGRLGMAIGLPSDAVLRQPDDPQLQGRMDRELQIRYPNGLPELAPADNVAGAWEIVAEAPQNVAGAPQIAAEAPAAWEAVSEADAVPAWQPIPEAEHEEIWIESGSWPVTGSDAGPDEGPEPADDPAHAR